MQPNSANSVQPNQPTPYRVYISEQGIASFWPPASLQAFSFKLVPLSNCVKTTFQIGQGVRDHRDRRSPVHGARSALHSILSCRAPGFSARRDESSTYPISRERMEEKARESHPPLASRSSHATDRLTANLLQDVW